MKFSKLGYSALVLAAAAGMAMAGCDGDSDIDVGGDGGADNGTGGAGAGTGTGGRDNSGTGGMGGDTPIEPVEGFCPEGSTTPTDDTLSGNIDSHVCLTAARRWLLDGAVIVTDGGLLTIESGAVIAGLTSTLNPAALVISRGGKIDAQGTPSRPIVFTSEFEAGDRVPGDWGGVIMLGKAKNNSGLDSVLIEGFSVTSTDLLNYGGTDDADSSGTLTYARIEFGGFTLTSNNEINGLTLGSIGSGTTINHVMVSNTLDDGFEWFGGTATSTHLVVNNAGDDMFDADLGFRGTLTNLFGRHLFSSSENPNGFEWDSNEKNPTNEPFTNVKVENVTLCTGDQQADTIGMMLRRGITGDIKETVVVGFDIGYSLRNANWVAGSAAPVAISNSTVFGSTVQAQTRDGAYGYVAGSVDTHAPALTAATAWFSGVTTNSTATPGFTAQDCLAEGGPAAAVTGSGKGAFKASATWLNEAWVNWQGN